MEPDSRTVGWNRLSWDLMELILSYLPLRSIVLSSSVCKLWHSIITHSSFPSLASSSRPRKPWFFLYGLNNVFLRNNQAFAFDPDSDSWILLPSSSCSSAFSSSLHQDFFVGSGGFFFFTTSSNSALSRFCYAPLLRGPLLETPPLRFSRCNPLVAVFYSPPLLRIPQFIVVGGVRFVGGLVDIEDRLAVEIYDPSSDSWELCPPLPTDFRTGNSSQWLCSALLHGRFFVFHIYSCFVASFDLARREWSGVQTLRPPGVLFSFLIPCRDRLVLAGLCNTPGGAPSFVLWHVDDCTMEFSEIAAMPQDLLSCLFDSDEDDKFASLKCVGLDGLVYVFNEDHHRAYPACICEIGDGGSPDCTWRKVPAMPGPVNRFHKVIAFCSTISLQSVLAATAN